MREKYRLSREENRHFYRMVLALVLPIALQELINVAISGADVIMLGLVGEDVLSGASLAGQVQFIMKLVLFGLSSGASVLIAQYWGKRDMDAIEKVFGIGIRVGICTGLFFMLVSLLFPEQIMRIFTNDPAVITEGVRYLKILAWSFVVEAFTVLYLNLLRGVERVLISTVVYSIALVTNIILNSILIFGLLGFPAMAVRGAAIATVLSRILAFLVVVIYALSKKAPVKLRKKYFIHTDKLMAKDFVVFSVPVILNELFWGSGMSANAAIIGHLGSAMVAANSVTQVTRQLIMVLAFGLSGATAVILGKTLGEKKPELAETYAGKLLRVSVCVTAVGAVILVCIRRFVISNLSLTQQAGEFLYFMLFLIAIYAVLQTYNMILIVGAFRAGGDTKVGLLLDVGAMWLFAIPFGFIAAFVLKWNPYVVYMILLSDEVLKVPLSTIRYRQKKWLKNITR